MPNSSAKAIRDGHSATRAGSPHEAQQSPPRTLVHSRHGHLALLRPGPAPPAGSAQGHGQQLSCCRGSGRGLHAGHRPAWPSPQHPPSLAPLLPKPLRGCGGEGLASPGLPRGHLEKPPPDCPRTMQTQWHGLRLPLWLIASTMAGPPLLWQAQPARPVPFCPLMSRPIQSPAACPPRGPWPPTHVRDGQTDSRQRNRAPSHILQCTASPQCPPQLAESCVRARGGKLRQGVSWLGLHST